MGLMDEEEKLVMVGRYLDPSEAQMARGMLESAGVECFLQGENANAMVPLAFRVRLEVRRADEAAARELLEETGDE
jgi:8-oxo-dGTP pyrophosphatase MutT (NUDIX family)